mgnify:CR=1 FL=1
MFDIITDSACDLTPETATRLNVEVIPFYVSLDGEHYRKEGKEIAVRDFYQLWWTILRHTPRPACLRWKTSRRRSALMLRRAARCSASASPAK